MNQNFFKPNPCYDSKSFGFDQIQTPQQFVNHQPSKIPEVIPFVENKEWIETKNEFYKMMEAYTKRMSQQQPDNSLSMGDEHLGTILETESDEVIKSSVENFVSIPSEFEDFSDNESECDVPVCDDFTTLSNPLFDPDDDFSSSDDELFSVEDEFSGELAHIDLVLPRINKADFDPEEEIRLIEELFDSHVEEIDLFLATDDLMPPGIEYDDYDSEGDIHFLKEFLSDDPLPLPENESFNFDHHDNASFPRPPPEPPNVEVFFDFEPDTGVLTAKVVEDISEHYVLMPNILPTQPTLCLNIDTLLPFSSENKDKVFKPGILSYLLVSHRDKITSDFSKIPMMISGGNIPHLDVSFLYFYPP
uniref:Reverse transcriptase domain-containing protein n=1 Tax=Tanacetum cinerariifolium TaxID=118510 RepID=A0A6L2KT96_TANCI|nr:hypothetical protein [Tanacetum cinerariifolium]